MSKITASLEAAVACVIENTPEGDARQTNRQRVNADRAFAKILKLIAPRIRHFIRQYGLGNHWDDAEQCCAIGVHRAIQGYDPKKAQFTTFVNWQIRGELQSLRFRLMTDQRPSAKKVDATTISLHSGATGVDGEQISLEAMIEDDEALALTQSGAAQHLAAQARKALVDAYVDHLRKTGTEQLKRRARAARPVADEVGRDLPRFRPGAQPIDAAALAALEEKVSLHREVIERRLFGEDSLDDLAMENGLPKERIRQISKRAAKTISDLADGAPQFAPVLEPRKKTTSTPTQNERAAAISIIPQAEATHNQRVRVTAVEVELEQAPELHQVIGLNAPAAH